MLLVTYCVAKENFRHDNYSKNIRFALPGTISCDMNDGGIDSNSSATRYIDSSTNVNRKSIRNLDGLAINREVESVFMSRVW